MPDPAPKEAEPVIGAEEPSSSADETLSPTASLLLKLWNFVMLVSTAILSFYVFVLKDNSVAPFVMLGIVGLCIPPVVGLFRSMARNKRLRLEHERRMQEAQLERIRQARERERERLQREQMVAANEAAMQEAIKNTDISAHKVQ